MSQHIDKYEAKAGERYLWRMPIGFGPAHGPRQTGKAYDFSKTTYATYVMRFRTPKAYLEQLLPTAAFRLPDKPVVEASYSITAVDNVPWLAGAGYNVFQFHIHGMQYHKTDGSVINGSYLALLFETAADTIITGREELGMPKMFCDLDIQTETTGTKVAATWRGAKFATFEWTNLEQDDTPKGAGEGQFYYKYSPAVGQPGVADAEYAVFLDRSKAAPLEPTQRWTASASVKFDALDMSRIPTLHHVIKIMGGVETEMIKAEIETGFGLDDLRYVQRIE